MTAENDLIMNVEKLRTIKSLRDSRWSILEKVVAAIGEGAPALADWGSEDSHLDEYRRLDKMDTWSTYQGCLDMQFSLTPGQTSVVCMADVWNGHNLDGERTTHRFRAEITLELDFLQHLEPNIEYAFQAALEGMHAAHLQKQKLEWMHTRRVEILAAALQR